MPLMRYFKYELPLQWVLALFAINFVSIFALIFVTMLIYGESVKKRRKKLDEEFD
jgi:Ca2+-dependent lipid-binding protein